MDPARYDLLARVASAYHESGLTQQSIAEELGVSRVKVYRLLKEARERGVFEITVHWRIEREPSLERELEAAFGLEEAIILGASTLYDPGSVLPNLGELVARYLEAVLREGMSLAICVGRSTYAAINALDGDFRPRFKVVQAVGSLPMALGQSDSAEIVRGLGSKLDLEVMYLSSPPLADDPQAADIMRRQPGIKGTLEAARAADIALVGIGDLAPEGTAFLRAGLISPEELEEMERAGAVGEIVGWPYDLEGRIIPDHFTQRLIGISLRDLKRVPTTIAVASGLEKAGAILGALRTESIQVFCTDSRTASAVLELRKD
jgi:DNA-binding transcriptional regulator LsrR (DeoR family)